MPFYFLKKSLLKRLFIPIMITILVIFAFAGGRLFQIHSLLPQHTLPAGNSTTAESKAENVPPTTTAAPLSQQAQTQLTSYLDYLKSSPSGDIKLTDYKIQGIKNITQHENKAYAVISLAILPANNTSKQILHASGGQLQEDGWIVNKLAYIVLINQKGTYNTKQISFSKLRYF